MPQLAVAADSVADRVEVHLLNVGKTAYGDCILCLFGSLRVLIDGSHPGDDQASDRIKKSVPEQLADLLGQTPDALHVDLLIVTHAHADHFGCLPNLIQDGHLTTDWALVADPELGWGHRPGEQTDATLDPRVRRVMEFFRDDTTDDVPFPESGSAEADAGVSQEASYGAMVTTLEESAKTVRYRDNQPPNGGHSQSDLQQFFKARGLDIEILGPTAKQLFLCAEGLGESLRQVRQVAQDALSQALGSDSPTSFESLLSDARNPSRAGNFVNLQSLVTVFSYRDKRLFFSGDMQLVDPTTQFSKVVVDPGIYDELTALRGRIASAGPFDFAKLGHHGSHNATDDKFIDSLGETVLFGICLGEFSPNHPSPETLEILSAHQKQIQWIRTDFNGGCSFVFDSTGVHYALERGRINDLRANPGKRGSGPEDSVLQPQLTSLARVPAASSSASGSVRLETLVPFGTGKVEISLTVTPPTGSSSVKGTAEPTPIPNLEPGQVPDVAVANVPSNGNGKLVFAGGRQLAKLLFVTSQRTLGRNIGKTEVSQILQTLAAAGMEVLADLPEDVTFGDFDQVSNLVTATLRSDPTIRGVVLLGGMDVVPSKRVDTLPDELRRDVRPADDRDDNFFVWCDDTYGLRGPSDFVPVSRIPDGQYAPLMFNALSAAMPEVDPSYRGIRNYARPFATQISPYFPDNPDTFMVSYPVEYNNPSYFLKAENAYIMLHGDYGNGREFVGETANGRYLSAMRIQNVPDSAGHVVFAGCCWGALTSTVTASRTTVGQPIQSRGHNDSIALKFLENGALAFVGCTGAHYPPQKGEDVNTLGGAMHKAFWDSYLGDDQIGPAAALCKAKEVYLKVMPHGQTDPFRRAVEFKTYYQFTCLGLGW